MLFFCRFFSVVVVFSCFNNPLHAQAPVTIPIETGQYALVLQTDQEQRLGIVYFGKKLAMAGEYSGIPAQYRTKEDNAGIYHNAYTPAGTWNLVEPAIAVAHADGNSSLDLHYVSHETQKTDANTTLTTVLLRDPVYPFEVTLHYKSWAKENVFEQWSVIRHREKGAVLLKKYASANLYFSADKYFLTHYHGTWAQEMKPEETQLTAGIKTLDSKLGTRANLFQPGTFTLAFDQPAAENEGKVLLGQLAWSGNFKIDFEGDSYRGMRLIAGINPYASEYQLPANQTFTTPSFLYAYSENGRGEATRNLHRWARQYRILDGQGERLTLLNNWEATYFDFDENKLTGLFAGAKNLGVDLFLLDDGWFANKYPRNSDRSGLGDWQENRKKLPQGIGYLVREATKAGVKFGIWVEPEMVNPKSELYEQHLDWILRQPERPEHYFRNQLVLDLANPEVQDFVFGVLDGLFTKNPSLAFIKWDCNAVVYDAHSMYLQRKGLPQTHVYTEYVFGLYRVLERLRAKYPKVPMMLCSGGGGRVDYGALKYFTEFWVSDNTDPIERIFQQWEYSYYYPAIAQCNHVTDWSKVGIKYRTDVAMMGKLGYDIVVDKLPADDLAFSKAAVANYRAIRDVIWYGDLYHLSNPWEKPTAAVQFVNEKRDRSVLFAYFVSNRFMVSGTPAPLKLSGLDPQKKYKVRELNLYPGTSSTLDTKAVYSGDFLMTVGFNPDVHARRTSVVVELMVVE